MAASIPKNPEAVRTCADGRPASGRPRAPIHWSEFRQAHWLRAIEVLDAYEQDSYWERQDTRFRVYLWARTRLRQSERGTGRLRRGRLRHRRCLRLASSRRERMPSTPSPSSKMTTTSLKNIGAASSGSPAPISKEIQTATLGKSWSNERAASSSHSDSNILQNGVVTPIAAAL